MTPKSLKQARISAQAITEAKGKTVWKEVLKTSGMVQDDYMLNNCDPSFQLQLLDHVDALEKIAEEYRNAMHILSDWKMRQLCILFYELGDEDKALVLETIESLAKRARAKALKELES